MIIQTFASHDDFNFFRTVKNENNLCENTFPEIISSKFNVVFIPRFHLSYHQFQKKKGETFNNIITTAVINDLKQNGKNLMENLFYDLTYLGASLQISIPPQYNRTII